MNSKIGSGVLLMLALGALACGLPGGGSSGGGGPSEITVTAAPIIIGPDLTAIDVCAAIPPEALEAAVGRQLSGPPEPFVYYDVGASSGCAYDFGEDQEGNLVWGYVALNPPEVFDQQPLYLNEDVSGLGSRAFFNNGPDARHLWVLIEGKVSFVVAFGDVPNEPAALAIARLVAAAIQ